MLKLKLFQNLNITFVSGPRQYIKMRPIIKLLKNMGIEIYLDIINSL